MSFSQGHSGTKVQCESCSFSQGKTPEFTKMGEIQELFSGDRKWCRQTGSRQSTPLSTIRTRYGNSVSTPEATRTGKTQQNSPLKGGRYRISVSTPHRRYGHRLRTPFFADAISETPIFVLALSLVWFAGATPESRSFSISCPMSGMLPALREQMGQEACLVLPGTPH